MSDAMLHGVLQMPPGMWDNDNSIDVAQRYSRYLEAFDRITADGKIIEGLMAVFNAAKNLRDVKGRYHSEQAYRELMTVVAKVELRSAGLIVRHS